ncbi:MAG: glycine cleavage system protein GcvH [Clostridia bacterium]|nr:glycine cleavage system protein GcvH [Clostridia bacterium]MBR4635034.1 glycine cleavage system protein GcvH [Clostridia bacterium]
MIPTDRKYTREHDWVMIEDGIAALGITDHAQEALGDIVYVELPEVDGEIAIGDDYTTVESVKAASPVASPVAGRIVEVNEALDEQPELLNEDAYGQFIAKVEVTEIDEAALLTAEEYEALLAEEE